MVRIKEGQHPGRELGCDQFSLKDGPACVLFYTNSKCIFCPTAKVLLEERLRAHYLLLDSIHEVDCDKDGPALDVTALPTIDICGKRIVGIPEEDRLDIALWKLRVTPCFHSIK